MEQNKKITAIESLTGVMQKISGVAKRDRNEAQRFNFRGIDAVVNAVGPALREVGGAIIPTVIEKNYERGTTKNGSSTVEVFLTIEYAWHGTDGGEPIRAVVVAEAMDMSDKATAKAMSVGLRTYLLQTLMLPTDEKDPDADYIERGAVAIPAGVIDAIRNATSKADLDVIYKAAVSGKYFNEIKSELYERRNAIAPTTEEATK